MSGRRRGSPGGSRGKTGSRALLLVGGLLSALAVSEAIVRLLPRRWLPELQSNDQEPMKFYLGGIVRLSANRALGFELIPDNRDAGINAAGYRGPLVTKLTHPDAKRVVGIGDSTLFGLGVAEPDTCLRQLEGMLRAEAAPVQVVNLAVPGYNSRQELEMLKVRGLEMDPDLLILGYDHNDAEIPLEQAVAAESLPRDYGQNAIQSELVRYVSRKVRARSLRAMSGVSPENERFESYFVRGPLWEDHRAALAELGALASQRNIPVVVLVYDAWIRREPVESSEHYRKLHMPLDTLWKELRFHVVDCYTLFQSYMRQHDRKDIQSLWVRVSPRRDGHPNAAGHQLIAEALLELIQSRGLLR
jgi:lysophospholipase L1-like esterase